MTSPQAREKDILDEVIRFANCASSTPSALTWFFSIHRYRFTVCLTHARDYVQLFQWRTGICPNRCVQLHRRSVLTMQVVSFCYSTKCKTLKVRLNTHLYTDIAMNTRGSTALCLKSNVVVWGKETAGSSGAGIWTGRANFEHRCIKTLFGRKSVLKLCNFLRPTTASATGYRPFSDFWFSHLTGHVNPMR